MNEEIRRQFEAERPPPCHGAELEPTWESDNEDRTRVDLVCRTCGQTWSGCRAKRLAPEPDSTGNREAWGPVGSWRFRRLRP